MLIRHFFSWLAFYIIFCFFFNSAGYAIPAKPGQIKYSLSNGETISVLLHGDENFHFYTSTDGYVLIRKNGDFYYAKEKNDMLTSSGIPAVDVNKRSTYACRFLDSVNKQSLLNRANDRFKKAQRRKVSYQLPEEANMTSFPTTGSPKIICILVQFKDKKFTTEQPHTEFSNMLKEKGYNKDGATGSIYDFFTESSNQQFTPQIELYGPVTLPHNMSYYGKNNEYGTDTHPEQMVTEACALIDDQVDFRDFDNDNDGIIDNVYIFYAGYGEADGGPEESIWPHSWDLEYASKEDFFFDGIRLNHYACSNELRNGVGTLLAGIGVFCHEFSHVMGLPDLYSTSYSGEFTPGTWSLMDMGSYNNESHTPPLHTGYERYCLGWLEPKELKDPSNVRMRTISDEGHYNDVFMIKTPDPKEYYILENRQKKGWDTYLKGHGMLIWHINFDLNKWQTNTVNVGEQHIDIVEADADPIYYSVDGDPFPGSKNITEFTDDTTPSMRTWKGEALHSPITSIQELDGEIIFLFKGGEDIFNKVAAMEASEIKAGSFRANWQKVEKASGYLISVYEKGMDDELFPIENYSMKNVGDIDNALIENLTPETTYYYEIRAFNGIFYSNSSNLVEVRTLAPTIDFKKVTVLDATDIKPTSFRANWEPLQDAESYSISVFTMQLGEPFKQTADFTNNQLPTEWETSSSAYDNRSVYSKEAPSLRLSNEEFLITASFPQFIRTIDFWYRANSDSEDNYLDLYGRHGDEWTLIKRVQPVKNTSGGTLIQQDVEGMEYEQLKLAFYSSSNGKIYLDDVTVSYGGELAELPLKEYNSLNIGDVSTYNVTELQPGSTYAYTIRAHQGELQSLESEKVSVNLPSESGLDRTFEENVCSFFMDGRDLIIKSRKKLHIIIYDLEGHVLIDNMQNEGSCRYSMPTQGLYAIKADDTIYKVLVAY